MFCGTAKDQSDTEAHKNNVHRNEERMLKIMSEEGYFIVCSASRYTTFYLYRSQLVKRKVVKVRKWIGGKTGISGSENPEKLENSQLLTFHIPKIFLPSQFLQKMRPILRSRQDRSVRFCQSAKIVVFCLVGEYMIACHFSTPSIVLTARCTWEM